MKIQTVRLENRIALEQALVDCGFKGMAGSYGFSYGLGPKTKYGSNTYIYVSELGGKFYWVVRDEYGRDRTERVWAAPMMQLLPYWF